MQFAPLPEGVAAALARERTRFASHVREILYTPALPSTMDAAAAMADAGRPHGLLVLAGQQAAGRGRRGHRWSSPAGAGLYFSLVVRPPVSPQVDGEPSVLGLMTLHVTPVIHRATPVGRITVLVVAPDAQGTGVGRALVEAAERHFLALGLERVEVTSGLTHVPAYDFYRHLGYQDHGVRFARVLA